MMRYRGIAWPKICIAATALIALLLAGCNNDGMDDLRKFVEETKTKFKGQIEPLPKITPYESYRYHVGDQRDPFRPVVRVRSVEPGKGGRDVYPDVNRRREELERYGADTLRMMGILQNNGESWAAVRTPDGTIYRVRKGNYLGLNHGKITHISETKIEIIEIVPDGLGGWVKRPNSLSLTE